ncbi:MAG: phosphodiester glycosidase family protein [Candidatus Eremiobacteraeota bacterium]|nr:phosphodiester glycosidase family protein [Candidatus Eremiobacteraeota bacterium]
MRTLIGVRSSRRLGQKLFAHAPWTVATGIAVGALILGIAVAWTFQALWLRVVLGVPRDVGVQYDAAAFRSGALRLEGLRLSAADGNVTLAVPHADISGIGFWDVLRGGAAPHVVLREPELRIAPESVTATGFDAAARDVAPWIRRNSRLRLDIDDGSLVLAAAPSAPASTNATPLLTLSHIGGTLSSGAGRFSYDADGVWDDGTASHKIRATASPTAAGPVVQHLTAEALPFAPLLSLLRTDPALVGLGGTLTEVDATYAEPATPGQPRLHVSARLSGGEATIGLAQHRLGGLHGMVNAVDDGLASPRIAGNLDGVPLEIAGEVHDVHGAPFAWLGDGTADLRQLVSLASSVAAQGHVRSIRVETVAPGIAFAQYATQEAYGPLVITVASIDPAEPTVRFDTVMAQDRVTSGGERTSSMAQRTGAVVGINGDYFDIGGTWAPQGVVIHSGVLLRTPTARMALTVHRGNRVSFEEYRLRGTLRVGAQRRAITQINNWPAGDVTFITPEYGKIPASPDSVLALLQPVGHTGKVFRITAVGPANLETSPTFALAFGPRVDRPALAVGEVVSVDYGLTPNADDAVAALGGGPLLLRNGSWYEDPHAPAPDERDVHWAVVALARMADGALMIFQVDGRHPERSIGMTRPDFAELMRGFGVVDAMALDSGGSATFVSRAPGQAVATVRNHPSDNDGERFVSNGLFVYSSAPQGELLNAAAPPVGAAPSPLGTAGRPSPLPHSQTGRT